MNDVYIECFEESIRCHHNDFANYFQSKLLIDKEEQLKKSLFQGLENYNFAFIQNDLINLSSFYYVCLFDYYPIADILIKDKDVDINAIFIKTLNTIQANCKILNSIDL